MSQKTLVVIPSRIGSKGIPRKNLRKLLGLSLTEWALRFAEQTSADAIVLSSDSEEVLEIATRSQSRCLARLRPAEFASDTAIDRDVLADALEFSETNLRNQIFDRVVMLQPTAPGRELEPFFHAINLHNSCHAPYSTSVWSVGAVPAKFHPRKQVVANSSGSFEIPLSSALPPRRQDLTPSYIRNGDFYILGRGTLEDPYLAGSTLIPAISSRPVINIDDEEDFGIAEQFLEVRSGVLSWR